MAFLDIFKTAKDKVTALSQIGAFGPGVQALTNSKVKQNTITPLKEGISAGLRMAPPVNLYRELTGKNSTEQRGQDLAKFAKGVGVVGLGSLGTVASFGIGAALSPQGQRAEGGYRGIGMGQQYGGLSKFTSPAIANFAPKSILASRLGQGALNVGEGIAMSGVTKQPYNFQQFVLDAFLGSGGKPFSHVDGPIVSRVKTSENAKNILKGWWTETNAQTAARRKAGLSPTEAYGATKKVVDTEKFKGIFAKWIGQRDAARTTGVEESAQFKAIPNELGPEIIKFMEGGSTSNPEIKSIAGMLRQRFDQLYTEAKKANLDIGYLKNYVSHYWKQTQEEVEAVYKGAKTKIGHRKIPTYEEGIALGLEPRFTNPSQILGTYAQKLNELKANLEFINTLKKEGLIVPAAKREAGMVELIGPGFPKSKAKTASGETVIGSYFADAKVAQTINRVFSPEDVNPIIGFAGKAAGAVQDIRLAGGIPGTPLNSWTFIQVLFKELPSGRVKGPLKALWVSMTGANKYFEENAATIKTMQKNNIPVSTSLNIESQGRNWLQNAFGENLGEFWHKLVNEPTFKKFMPAMEIEFFKDTLRVAKKNGMSDVVAEEVASKATINFYGIVSSDALAQRGALGENLKTIMFMAPRYRETVLGFLYNTIKGLKAPLAPENIANTRWLAGAVIMYGIYDLVNLKNTGNHMHENPPGLEDKILVPVGKHTIGIPYMSSILTLPRAGYRATKELFRGDIGGAIGEVGSSTMSIGLKPFVDIARNQDYYGNEITPQNSTASEKLKGNVGYIARQWMHPYVAELTDSRYKDDPAYQRLSRAVELPLRFYETNSILNRWYFASQDEVLRTISKDKQATYEDVYITKKEPKTTIEKKQQAMAEAQTLLANPDIIEARRAVLFNEAQKSGKAIDPFFLLSPAKQKIVLQRDAQAPGSKEADSITSTNIEWLKPYWTARSAYFEELKTKGTFKEAEELPGPKFVANDEVVKLQDQYFNLPYGTGQRTQFLQQHPELKAYWEEKASYENEMRVGMGLPPIESGNYGKSWPKASKAKKPKLFGALKGKKVTVKRIAQNIFKPLQPIKQKKLKNIKN